VTAILRSEWTKLRTIRSTGWMLALTLVVSTGLNVVNGLSVRHAYQTGNGALVRPDFDAADAGFLGLVSGQLALLAFGALLVTTEYGSGTIRATLAAVPRRGPAYAGKLMVGCAVALVAAAAAALISWSAGEAGLGPYGVAMSAPGVLRALAASVAYLTLICAFAAGVAAVLRHPALTLGVLIPLFFLVGPILSLVPGADRAARFLPDQAGLAIMTVRPPAAGALTAGQGLLVMTMWTVLAVGAGYFQLRRRDA
jgi:ABC-2 type transport system permease protein